MSDTNLKTQINAAQQDAITLDYSKWSAQRRSSKLPADHEIWQRQRDAVLSRQQSENDEAGRRHRESIEAAKLEKRSEAEKMIDRELEPQKQILMREWLANHPGKSAEDFNKSAWIHLRENLIEQRNAQAFNAEIRSQVATGRYSL